MIQVENDRELAQVYGRLAWAADPQGIPWETFLTTGASTVYGLAGAVRRLNDADTSCCTPDLSAQSEAQTCCTPKHDELLATRGPVCGCGAQAAE